MIILFIMNYKNQSITRYSLCIFLIYIIVIRVLFTSLHLSTHLQILNQSKRKLIPYLECHLNETFLFRKANNMKSWCSHCSYYTDFIYYFSSTQMILIYFFFFDHSVKWFELNGHEIVAFNAWCESI